MKRLLTMLVMFCLWSSLCWSAGLWRITETVDSIWAGTVQVKWNSATGVSFHSTGTGGTQTTWLGVLQHIIWTPIAAPTGGWKAGPNIEDRFNIRPHVVFGRAPITGDRLDPRRHGVFLIDTYTGAAYVMTKNQNTTYTDPNFPFHDEFTLSYWTYIQEASDLPSPPISDIGRYEISAVNSTLPLADGRLGPYVTRLDRVTGRVDVAIPKLLLNSNSTVVDFVWYPIGN